MDWVDLEIQGWEMRGVEVEGVEVEATRMDMFLEV